MRRGIGGAMIAAALAACGGGSSSTQGNGSCTPGMTATVSITSAGVSPKAVCVLPTGTVTFHNTDTIAHDIEFAGTCAQPSSLTIAANSSDTTSFPTTSTCTFTDATKAGNTAFAGTVAVANQPTSGPGY